MSIEMLDGTLRIQQIIADAEHELKSTIVEKDLPLELDSGNMMIVDINSLDEPSLRSKSGRQAVLASIARDGIQTLIGGMFKLERTSVDNLPYAVLPPPTTILPREKHAPKAKVLTKWEQYAKTKGIIKKKKEKKVWDEAVKDFVPRYGKLKVQVEKEKNWVIEIPRQSDPFEDQFAKAADAKKERIAKNEYQRLRNIARAMKTGTPGVGVTRTDTRDVRELKKAMHYSRHATASLGKFQPKLRDERDIKGFSKNARRESDKPFVGAVRTEKNKALSIIDKIARPQVNTDSAIIKNVEAKMIMNEVAERKNANKVTRRSKLGGRKVSKSGAALASLTDGRKGDKSSRRAHAAKKDSDDSKGKKSGKKKSGGKRTDRSKSMFGGAMGKKSMVKAGGKTKDVVKKRRR